MYMNNRYFNHILKTLLLPIKETRSIT